jgi:ParB/RepB/Spo0J family partition protein
MPAAPATPARPARTPAEPKFLAVPWERVAPDPRQPREHFDAEALAALAASIAAEGQQVPAHVAPLAGDPRHDYVLIDGERRWRAVRSLGAGRTLRVLVIDEPDPERRFARSVVANMAREGHAHLEIAHAIRRMRAGGRTLAEVARALGKSDGWATNYASLLNLHPDLAEMLGPETPRANRLPLQLALRLATLDPSRQVEAFHRIRAKAGDSESPSLRLAASVVLADMPEARRAHALRNRPDKDRWRIARLCRQLRAEADRIADLADQPKE